MQCHRVFDIILLLFAGIPLCMVTIFDASQIDFAHYERAAREILGGSASRQNLASLYDNSKVVLNAYKCETDESVRSLHFVRCRDNPDFFSYDKTTLRIYVRSHWMLPEANAALGPEQMRPTEIVRRVGVGKDYDVLTSGLSGTADDNFVSDLIPLAPSEESR